MRLTALLLGLLIPALPCGATETAQSVLANLNQPERFSASFVQTKSVPGINKALLAEGRLVYVAGKGALWKVERPRPWHKVLLAKVGGESKVQREVADVVAAVLTGEPATLARHFDMEVAETPSGKGLRLTPKAAALREVISSLTLGIGDGHIRSVSVEEASGGSILIQFERPMAHYEPSAEETRLLESGDPR